LKNKSISEKKSLLSKMSSKRDSNYIKLKALMKKRDLYIKSEEKKKKDTISFSKEVIKIMKKQSEKN
jgi:hypothetical protein